ncbi:MAG: hypothetical protein AAF191_07375, partial [Verrucomicrobiota bacterium]
MTPRTRWGVFAVPWFFVLQLGIAVLPGKATASTSGERVIMDFETGDVVSAAITTHKAVVAAAADTPEQGGKWAAKTTVDFNANAASFFGAGFHLSTVNLSAAEEIRFWIKTDVAGGLGFQLHSDDRRATTFRFQVNDRKAGAWQQITAPLTGFNAPAWSKGSVDLA